MHLSMCCIHWGFFSSTDKFCVKMTKSDMRDISRHGCNGLRITIEMWRIHMNSGKKLRKLKVW